MRQKQEEKFMEEKNWTYILLCADGTLYTGWTNNLSARIKTHQDGKGAKYTRTRRPVKLAYQECFSSRREAMQRECEIKQMPRKKKLELVPNTQENAEFLKREFC